MATTLQATEPKRSDYATEREYAQAWAAWGNLRQAAQLEAGSNNTVNDDNSQAGRNNTSATTLGGGAGSATIIPTNISGQKSGTALIDEQFPGARKENPLGNYSSSAYAISLYMCTAEYLNKFVVADPPGKLPNNSDGIFVAAQSGGINNSFDRRLLTKNRRLGFGEEGLDYYIEDLTLDMAMQGNPTNLSTVVSKINFKIIEPIGFSFMQDLAIASTRINGMSDLAKRSPDNTANALQQNYIIGIRFYGYDVNGAVVNPGTNPTLSNMNTEKTDKNSIAERFIPMLLTSMTFKLDDKATVYSFEGQPTSLQVAFSEKNNAIKSTVSVQGSTVGDTLDDLIKKLNLQQQTFADDSVINIPTVYKIEWVGGESNSIPSSLIIDDTYVEKPLAPMYSASSTQQVTAQGSFRSRTYDTTKKSLAFNTGSSIVEIIDNVITKSSFISDALNQINTGETQSTGTPNANLKELEWYYINPVTQILGRDDKINDWVYSITYQIGVYKIPYIRTQYKNKSSKYPGPYKVYNYIYTGENSEVIDFEQTYNNLYNVYKSLVTSDVRTDDAVLSKASDRFTENVALRQKIGSVPLNLSPSSNTNSIGGKQNSGSAINENVRAQLFSEGDQVQAVLKIMGDPDWIMSVVGVDQQISSLYRGETGSIGSKNIDTVNNLVRQNYGPDYSINPYGGQIFIQIIFGIATDYQDNGLLDAGNDVTFYPLYDSSAGSIDVAGNGIQGAVYKPTKILSSFSRGQFTQTMTDMDLIPWRQLLDIGSTDTSNQRELDPGTFIDADQRATNTPAQPQTNRPGDFSGDFINIDQQQTQPNQRYADDDRAGHSGITTNTTQQPRQSEGRTTR